MTGISIFGWLSAALQLVVPSYGLRLVRRFGAQSVGWFLVAAFSCMALLHLIGPFKAGNGANGGMSLDAIYAVGALLLLVGMGHVETMFVEREQSRSKQKKMRSAWISQSREDAAELARTNEELREALENCEIAAKALRETEAQYRLLFTDHPYPMWILDLRTSRFLAVNKAALRQYGFTQDEFMALTVRDLLPTSAVTSFSQFLSRPCSGTEAHGYWQHRCKDLSLIDVEVTAMDLKFGGLPSRLVLASDIGPRRQREEDTLGEQKMQIIGQLAGGFAHHFNNLLAIIEGNASLLAQTSIDETGAKCTRDISTAVNRSADLTRQLLAVAGKNSFQVEPLDMNGAVRGHLTLLRRLVGEGVSIQNVYGSALPAALADTQLIERILVNLVLNARDAMPSGGTVTIATAAVRRDTAKAQPNNPRKSAEFIRLSVRDTGCGMRPEVQARLFEPFFTTKDIGQSVGLGLATVFAAVRQQSGWIEVTSEVGAGTEFRIFLPCATVGAVAPVRDNTPAPTLATVLLIEPDDRLRNLARCALNWNGYRVIEADCMSSALMFWESQSAHIELLLTDISLPGGASGQELAAKMLQAKPNLKVIFTSVASAGDTGRSSDLMVFKPYKPDSILRAVQSCLNS